MIDALPLKEGMRILEIGCGSGVVAREIVHRFRRVYVLAIDRSDKAIQQALRGSAVEMESGRLDYRHIAIEHFRLKENEARFDLAFAIRVGVFDGRHPELEEAGLRNIRTALKKGGEFFIDETMQSVEEIPLV